MRIGAKPRLRSGRFAAAAGNPDHARRDHTPAVSDAAIEQRLQDLVQPAVYREMAHYRQLGLRNRLLTLPTMVSVVLAMLWRHLPGVCELQRLLAQERVLWTQPFRVSQPALSERFLTFPAQLFQGVLQAVLRELPARSAARQRPRPPRLAGVAQRFAACYALDGTTLEALFRKLKALQEVPQAPLGGHLAVLVDVVSHLPTQLWYAEDPATNDKAFQPQILAWLPVNSLLVFDLGYFSFGFFDALTQAGSWFVTRLRAKTHYRVLQTLQAHPQVREQLIQVGVYRSNRAQHPLRLVEVYVDGGWRRYLTNVLDPQQLSVLEVVAVYQQRWQIERAFALVKRLLDLSYLWVGSQNGVQLQVWATWLYYAVLVDLSDAVAEELGLPLERISLEMVSRMLYYYAVRTQAGTFSGTAAQFLAQEAQLLGIVKRARAPDRPALLTQVSLAVDEQGANPMLDNP